MASSTHALLGPSSSSRWLNCTPSARLEESVEDKASEFAEEGSCAHALCEQKLWDLLGKEDESQAALAEQYANNYDKWYTQEMEDSAEDYVSTVWNKYNEAIAETPDAKLFIERRLDFSRWVPGSFGTADAIIITDGTMEVIDFKYGKGVEVSAVGNTQMMIYALGAIAEFEDEYDIRSVRMTIIQPRKDNYSGYEMLEEDLLSWGETVLRPRSAMADKGDGEQNPGAWCKFCKIKATCAKLANQSIAAYTAYEDKKTISDEQMPDLLALIPAIKSWADAVEEYATAQAVNGKSFKGYKLVEGRSNRKLTDIPSLVLKLDKAGYSPDDFFKPREIKTLGELEKLVGKKEFAELAKNNIEKPKGRPTLVPESDKRQAITVNTAEEDFKDLNLTQ